MWCNLFLIVSLPAKPRTFHCVSLQICFLTFLSKYLNNMHVEFCLNLHIHTSQKYGSKTLTSTSSKHLPLNSESEI